MIPLVDLGADAASWMVINDGVMGGRSSGAFDIRDGRATFEGTVSPENNGGFASVRSPATAADTSGVTEIALRVRGDGQRYQFRIRTDDRWDGPAYKHDFDTRAGEWIDVRLPLSGFVASFRGRTLADAPPVDPAKIRQIGFLIADEQYGPFRLEIERIEANGG